MSNTLPTYFILHGGGPWPWVPPMREFFAPLETSLKQMIADHGTPPKAILMISGHWEEDNVAIMIVGSGLSFHNLRLPRGVGKVPSAEFDAWLFDAMKAAPDERRQAMLNWETAPAARICHEEEDHLAPIFVALGAAEDEPAERIFHHTSEMTGITVSNYKFG